MQPVAFLLNFHLDSPQPQQGLAVITALATGQRSTANINDTLLLQLEI